MLLDRTINLKGVVMNKTIFIMLLGLVLSHTVYANNGENFDVSPDTEANNIRLLQQIGEALRNVTPEVSLEQEAGVDFLSHHPSADGGEHNQRYIRVNVNLPAFYGPHPKLMDGSVLPLNEQLLNGIELGIGQRRVFHDNIRVEVSGRWKRLHIGNSDMPMEMKHMPMMDMYDHSMPMMDMSMMPPEYGEAMNNLGIVGGIYLDRNEAANSSYNEGFYIGTTAALVRSYLTGYDSWLFSNKFKVGYIETLTRNIDIDVGVSAERHHNHELLGDIDRGQVEFTVHWYGDR